MKLEFYLKGRSGSVKLDGEEIGHKVTGVKIDFEAGGKPSVWLSLFPDEMFVEVDGKVRQSIDEHVLNAVGYYRVDKGGRPSG